MSIPVKDANGNVVTVATLDDLSKSPGTADANTLRVVSSSDDVVLGAITETAPITDTQAAGINGRLQRLAQRLTSLIGLKDGNQAYVGGVSLTPKFAPIAASSSGANSIVAAVAAKKIRVLAVWLSAAGSVNAKWQSATTPTDKTGLAYLAANIGHVLPYNPHGWFETLAGEALSLNLSAAIAVGGSLVYVEV